MLRCWHSAPRRSGCAVAELAGRLVLAGTVLLLLLGLARQFAVLGRRGLLFDRLAIVPQWKFFGQVQIASDPARFDDLHLLVRTGRLEDAGPWRELAWCEDRQLGHALWNPHLRSTFAVAARMVLLADAGSRPETAAAPTALAYLTVLRHCLDQLQSTGELPIQFAIATTRGRVGRSPILRFLSAWHSE